jgi:ribonuclease P protein component
VSVPGTPSAQVKVSRLVKRADFLRLSRGRRWSAAGLVLQMAPTPEPTAALRVGFTATKKLGNAVVRNRVKRRLREAARAVLPLLGAPGHDYVLIGREATVARPFAQLIDDLKRALRKVHGGRPLKAEER